MVSQQNGGGGGGEGSIGDKLWVKETVQEIGCSLYNPINPQSGPLVQFPSTLCGPLSTAEHRARKSP